MEFQILKKGREIFLTGCCLRSAMDGSGHPRLLPTEYLIVLLDEVILRNKCLVPSDSLVDSLILFYHSKLEMELHLD